ncbi:Crp/Fnr family transcriptional regulator [Phenylobacterium sp.]|uniref:Crp/Fnr family transcriptional regulator n=1 Tax=Phenylobacterium sp. TaxID=1871053 RepID=UPI0028122145|nr:Crp/Fnr family transcriptional regulator [Phenylobacterium sp.]
MNKSALMNLKPAFEGLGFRSVSLRKHEPLFHEGELATAVYRLERGCIRLQIDSEDGNREIVTFLFPEDVFFVGFKTYWASAYAVTDSSVAVYSLSAFWAHIAADAEAAIAALHSADELVENVAHHLALLTHARGDARLRWFLDWMMSRSPTPENGSEVHLPMSRRDIADFLGIAPETVSRLFLRMESRGELRRADGHKSVLRLPGR